MNRFAILIPATAGLFLMSCGGGGEPAKKDAEAPKSSATPAAPAGNASISGKAIYSGAKPVLRAVSMDATPACARMHKEPPKSEEVVLGADGSLKNVFVYVKAGLPDQKWPVPGKVTVDQVGCVYKPHVVGLMAGQDIEFLNSDETNHNIHPLPRVNREWNESQPPKGDPKVKQFPKEEIMMPVKCNVHPWMRLYVNVVAHPYFAVSGDDGTFTIPGLPAGEYTVEAAHERFGKQEAKVKVDASGTAKADFVFKAVE
ncbi:MAG: hypothetical protein FJW39_08090 [Acidobacteria bacterium]|nr:hypothetical protein [Acidobacteriota bacterium]